MNLKQCQISEKEGPLTRNCLQRKKRDDGNMLIDVRDQLEGDAVTVRLSKLLLVNCCN